MTSKQWFNVAMMPWVVARNVMDSPCLYISLETENTTTTLNRQIAYLEVDLIQSVDDIINCAILGLKRIEIAENTQVL